MTNSGFNGIEEGEEFECYLCHQTFTAKGKHEEAVQISTALFGADKVDPSHNDLVPLCLECGLKLSEAFVEGDYSE